MIQVFSLGSGVAATAWRTYGMGGGLRTPGAVEKQGLFVALVRTELRYLMMPEQLEEGRSQAASID
jgi:hypothetical protein